MDPVKLTFFILSMAVFTTLAFRFTASWGIRIGLSAQPSLRRRHEQVTPTVGGITILAAWFIGITFLHTLNLIDLRPHAQSFMAMTLSLSLLLALGLWDDFRGVRPRTKLVVQFLASSLFIYLEPNVRDRLEHLQAGTYYLVWPMAIAWLMAHTNAINLIDGLDGLAGTVSLFATASLLYLGSVWGTSSQQVTLFLLPLIPALVGFLVHNWHPARVFLGDNGSLTIGFLLASTSLLCPIEANPEFAAHFATILLILGYPIFDMSLAAWRRIRNGNSIFRADRSHLHHRLLRLGMTPRQICIFVGAISLYMQLNVVLISMHMSVFPATISLSISALGLFSLIFLLKSIERMQTRRLAVQSGIQDNPSSLDSESSGHSTVLATIDLTPLLESGMLEEKERIHEVLLSLRLMLKSLLRKKDSLLVSDRSFVIQFEDPENNLKSQDFETVLKERLAEFQKLYRLQYALASLPIKFERKKSALAPSLRKIA